MIELSGLEAGTELPALAVEPISRATLALFAGASGDHNPIHIDLDVASDIARTPHLRRDPSVAAAVEVICARLLGLPEAGADRTG